MPSHSEAAQRLIERFRPICANNKAATESAIICVEQIIEANPYYFYPGRKVTRIEDHSTVDYWKEVLEHLRKS